jgi:hypothetical protein
MTADCAAVSCDAKRQPAAIDSVAIVHTAGCLRWSSHHTAVFLFVLHGTNEIGHLLREASFCLL